MNCLACTQLFYIISRLYNKLMNSQTLQSELIQKIDQLKRIDKRVQANYKKYFQRKSSSEDDQKKQQGLQQYDEITNDWRKLNDNILKAIPLYMQKARSQSQLTKINTLKRQSQRIKDKIQRKIDKQDRQKFSLKSKAHLWTHNVVKSKLKESKKSQNEVEYQQIIHEDPIKPRSKIYESLGAIGKDKIQKIEVQIHKNEIRQNNPFYKMKKQQKEAHKTTFYMLVIFLLAICIFVLLSFNIGANMLQYFIEL